MFSDLNPILNQQTRLAIMSLLIGVEKVDFNFIKEKTKTTSGNLSYQLKKLESESYIYIEKTFVNNFPKTNCSITEKGKKAFADYVEAIKKYLNLQ